MTSNPFEEWDDVLEADWTADQERAWAVFRKAEEGDEVIWGNRKQPLTVNDRSWTDGLVELDVEGPRGGTYTLRERYEMGEPAYYADDSKANDLRFADEDGETGDRLSSDEYEDVLRDLETQALNIYSTGNYASYRDAVQSVVEEWSSDVQFGRWEGMDRTEDRLAIYRSVMEYSPKLESEYPGRPPQVIAENMLVDTLVERSQADADRSLVRDEDSYQAYVDTVSDDAMERVNSNRYDSVIVAVRDTVSEELEDRTQEFYRNVVQHSARDPMEYDYYIDVEEDKQYREMAFDVLHDDVLETVRARRRERGEHDPRPAGLRFDQYDMTVEALTEEALREHRINSNRLLRTTVEEVVETWASDVESGSWDPGFEEFSATDADDIFSSAVLHSEYEPSSFNPFSSRGPREMAEEVLINEVTDRAEQASEERDMGDPIPADEYLHDTLGLGITYQELRDDTDITPEEFVREAIANYEGDIGNLAGWTFIDELVEVGEYNVPQVSNDWVLVDFGLVGEDDRTRRCAWFHRETGNVLVLAGETTNAPSRGEYEYLEFNVFIQRWNDDEGPEFLVSDAPIHECMEFIYDYLGAHRSDVRVIETREGEFYVQDALEREKLDGEGLLSNFMPGLAVPGSGWVPERVKRAGKDWFGNVSETAAAKLDLQRDAARFAVLLFMEYTPYFTQRFLAGIKATPMYDRRKGAGVQLQMSFGNTEDEDGVGGDAEANIYVRPETMRRWRNSITPEWMRLGDPDQDLTEVQRVWNDVVEHVTDSTVGSSLNRGRARFLMLHLPDAPRGMPEDRAYRKSRRWALENRGSARANGRNPWYTLAPGETLDDEEIRDRVEWAQDNGVDKVFLDRNEMSDEGTLTMGDLDDDDELPIELAEEVGYSLTWDNATDYFGSSEDVEAGRKPADYKTFLAMYDAFRYVPQKGVLDNAFQWLLDEARRSEDFTFVDAYDMFRSNLVYNEVEHERNKLIHDVVQGDHIAPDRLFEDDIEETQYIWQPRDTDLRYAWDGAEVDSEQILFPAGSDGFGATLYWGINERGDPSDFYESIDYSLWRVNERREDGDEGRFNPEDYRQELTGNQVGPAENFVVITGYDRLWEEMSGEARQFVIDQMDDLEGHLPHDDLDWDDMDGVSLDVNGLFMRGLDAAGVTGRGNFIDKSELFPLSLNDIPGINVEPERPDVPTFEEWRDRRYGPGYDGRVPEESEMRARYMDEIEEYVAPDPLDDMGIDMGAQYESELERDVMARDPSGDYDSYEQFYADEFGESFEDVEAKFNADGLDDDQGDVFDEDSLPNVEEGDGE